METTCEREHHTASRFAYFRVHSSHMSQSYRPTGVAQTIQTWYVPRRRIGLEQLSPRLRFAPQALFSRLYRAKYLMKLLLGSTEACLRAPPAHCSSWGSRSGRSQGAISLFLSFLVSFPFAKRIYPSALKRASSPQTSFLRFHFELLGAVVRAEYLYKPKAKDRVNH